MQTFLQYGHKIGSFWRKRIFLPLSAFSAPPATERNGSAQTVSGNTDYDKKPKLIPGKQRAARRRRETEDPDKDLMRKARKNGCKERIG